MKDPVPISWNPDVAELEGHLDDNARWRRPDLAPGTAAWGRGTTGAITMLHFVCPCGCGEVATLPVRPGYGAYWGWDGNELEPTLTPSVLRCPPQSCGWHGYLTKGVFTTC